MDKFEKATLGIVGCLMVWASGCILVATGQAHMAHVMSLGL